MDFLRKPASPRSIRRIHAEEITTALSAREWIVSPEKRRPCSHAFLLGSGTGTARAVGAAPLSLRAPCLVWLPAGSASNVTLAAGASGYMLAVDDELIARMTEDSADALALRAVTERLVSICAEKVAPWSAEFIASFSAIAREVRHPQRASFAIVRVHLELILLYVWRISALPAAPTRLTAVRHVTVERYQELIEQHFREHWPISRYAETLEVSEDQLAAACMRELHKSPLAVVHLRLVEEARLRLERSAAPVELIAERLGFTDSGYFSRFFKKHVGQSPGIYRNQAIEARLREDASFAAWP